MRLFDLHCDTLTECLRKNQHLENYDGHVSLARGRRLQQWMQVFAIFVPDTLHGRAAADYFDTVLAFYRAEQRRQRFDAILALENGSALMGDPGQVDRMAKEGLRIIGITWNGANELGYGAAQGPVPGLTPAGKACVRRMLELGILPDVSHLNEAGFWEVARLWEERRADARVPFIASHSSCAALCPHPRNLTDDQIRAIVAAGGLIGLNLYPEFLGGEGAAREVMGHILHLIALGAAESIALGSDFDGCTLHPALAGIEKMEHLRQSLLKMGLPEEICEAFFWKNGARAFALE
ncbi:MAG: membrane dipeptidase [Oscillospiraceae bacterium]|nr:membrane dipeptidase [Oscillospiraceae bacterium]